MEKKIINGSELADKKLEVQENGMLKVLEEGRFIPEDDEIFWYLSTLGYVTHDSYVSDDEEIVWSVKHHSVFRTQKECEEYKRYLELLDEYTFEPDWDDSEQHKYHIRYNHKDNLIEYGLTNSCQSLVYYFEADNKRAEFISRVGIPNVKKFMFDI